MLRFLLIIVVAVLVYLVIRLAVAVLSTPPFKCATCRHRRRLDNDGVICAFGDKETFKNATHIANCPDHEPS
jgi:hypothetical protein